MPDIVNLRQHRKAKRRATAAKKAEDNRLAFGRTKAERTATAVEMDRDLKALEGHRRASTSKPDLDQGE